jgi:hypothetical protein
MMALAKVQADLDVKKAIDSLTAVIRLAVQGRERRLAAPNPFGGR